ncbi:hypothetical protein BT69DRAFT_151908 [Atractiella rhizophila]|nr:hypothetical protein BT69DRAFT_151908 [Atractiella rhizophila]
MNVEHRTLNPRCNFELIYIATECNVRQIHGANQNQLCEHRTVSPDVYRLRLIGSLGSAASILYPMSSSILEGRSFSPDTSLPFAKRLPAEYVTHDEVQC